MLCFYLYFSPFYIPFKFIQFNLQVPDDSSEVIASTSQGPTPQRARLEHVPSEQIDSTENVAQPIEVSNAFSVEFTYNFISIYIIL